MSAVHDGIIQATGDLFPTVMGLTTTKGVAMNPPPASILAEVNRQVSEAMATIPEGSRGALVGIATKAADGQLHVNVALATKVGTHVNVVSWIGRTWGQPVEGGAAVQVHF